MKPIILTLFLIVVSTGVASAQNNIEQATKSTREKFLDIKSRSLEMERVRREANKKPTSDDLSPKFLKIKEDFEEIQKISAKVLQITDVDAPSNHTAVLKIVSEINQRANRLKSNLFSDESKQGNEAKINRQSVKSEDLKTLLNLLNESIVSFAHNSMFQNANLVNSEDSLKAQNDLQAVINMSHTIKAKTKK